MYLITSHTSKNRSVSANETLSQKALSNMQPINNVSAAEETEQPLTRAATEIPINLEHFFVADIDNELDYVFLDEILYQSFNGTGRAIVAVFPSPLPGCKISKYTNMSLHALVLYYVVPIFLHKYIESLLAILYVSFHIQEIHPLYVCAYLQNK